MISYGIIVGFVNTCGTITGLMTADYGYSDSTTSLCGAIFIVGGIFGSALFGGITEVKKNYKFISVFLSCVTIIAPALFLIALPTDSVAVLGCSCFFIGFFGLALLPVGLDYAVEITYPVPEAVSCGLMLTSANVFGFTFSVYASILIGVFDENHDGIKYSMITFIVFIPLASVIAMFVKEDLRRIKSQE